MKFEFVEFYETPKNFAKKGLLGTLHLYCIDCGLDIRGIRVTKSGKGIFFRFPHFKTLDKDTGLSVSYPLIRWTKEETQKEMLDFLHKEVKPKILERLKNKDGRNNTLEKNN